MAENPETPSEVSPLDARFWLAEISAAKSRMDCWYTSAEEAQERYDATGGEDDDDATPFGSVNILWANVDTQLSAIGEDFGKPQVTRVNQPEDDGGLSRHVANVWERAIAAAVRDSNDNHDIALAARDMFLPGRGQVWQELEKTETERKGKDGKPRKMVWLTAPIVYLKHEHYLQGQADRWGSVPWVARRHTFTRDELVSECKMTKEEAAKVPLNITLPHDKKDEAGSAGKEQFQRAEVWEIWAKFPEKSRIFVAAGYNDKTLRHDPDPFRLKHFFPCPRPLVTNTTECETPITDFSRYENQASELDEISARIFILTAALQRKGIHDKAFKELADLSSAEEGTTIAVENWADLQNKGGLSKVTEWQDITPLALALVELHKQRDTLMKLIYELSGISDLARGHTDPDETATAQNLKQSFGSSRFKRREKESRRFAAEAYSIKGEVIAELFDREQLQEMSGIALPLQAEIDGAKKQLADLQAAYQKAAQAGQQLPPPNQKQIAHLQKLANTQHAWEDVAEVLQSDYRRCYSVECETDQTAFMDEEADKAAATQFFQTAIEGLEKLAPLIAGNPKTGEVYKKLFMFMLSRFRVGRAMEEDFERVFDEAIKSAVEQQAKGPPQDPKAQAEVEVAKAKVATAQANQKTAEVKFQTAQLEGQQAPVKAQTEAFQAQTKAADSAAKVQATHDANDAKRAGQQIDNIGKAEKLQFERETRATATEALLVGPTEKPNGASPL